MAVGIDKIGIYLPKRYVDMTELAEVRGEDPNKYIVGIGQEKMALNTKDEDLIAMGANAAKEIVKGEEELIDQVIFATESAFDYAKASSTYIHELLGIHEFAKSFEVKQACYSGTAGLQAAVDYVRLRPDRKALVIVADIARYGLESAGEPTQGAGALALLISSQPRIMSIDIDSVSFTTNAFDFFRPEDMSVPIVDGRGSMRLYQRTFVKILEEYKRRTPERYYELAAIAFHLPFSRMGQKALQQFQRHLRRQENVEADQALLDKWNQHYEASAIYGRKVGNIYTGSLYLSLLSLLDNSDLQAGDRLGLFSYGSGTVAEFVTGVLQSDYQTMIERTNATQQYEKRQKVTVAEYEKIFEDRVQDSAIDQNFTKQYPEPGFYLQKIQAQQHIYQHQE